MGFNSAFKGLKYFSDMERLVAHFIKDL